MLLKNLLGCAESSEDRFRPLKGVERATILNYFGLIKLSEEPPLRSQAQSPLRLTASESSEEKKVAPVIITIDKAKILEDAITQS